MQQPFGDLESKRSIGPEGQGIRGTTPSWDQDSPEAVPFGEFYARLRAIAEALMRRERPDHTLQTTELVHEAFLRMGDHPAVRTGPPPLLYAIASKVLRDVLVDHARRRGQLKRGTGWRRVALEVAEESRPAPDRAYDLLDLDDALLKLGARHQRQSRVIEMRFFGGMSNPDISGVLGVSARTVTDDAAAAIAWLRAELSGRELSAT